MMFACKIEVFNWFHMLDHRWKAVNGLAFFTTLGRDIRFGTAEYIPSRMAKQFAQLLMKIVELYLNGGFVVRTVIMDGEFEKIKSEVDITVDINISAAREHVGKI